MATIKRGQILRDDLALFDGVTRTSSRVDATGGTVTGLNVGDAIDVLQVFGNGTSRSVNTINDAISRLGGASGAFQFTSGTWTIDSDLTIPSTVACRIPAGCVFAISSGITLTIAGPLYSDVSSFTSGSGTFVLTADGIANGQPWFKRTTAEAAASQVPSDYSYKEYRAERYGIPVDGTDARAAIAAADSIGKLIFETGTTLIGSNLTISSDIFMYGSAKLKPDTGVTLTISGLYHAPEVGSGLDLSIGTITLSGVTRSVPSSYSTIQEAVDACPRRLAQVYNINLADGTYAEDVLVSGIRIMQFQPDTGSSLEGARLVIRGAALDTKDTAVTVQSILASGCVGHSGHPTVAYMTISGANPYDNEDASLAFYGCQNASAIGIRFTGGVDKCILSYGSTVGQSDSHDFGSSVNTHAYVAKHGGRIMARNLASTGIEEAIGVLVAPYEIQEGDILVDDYGILQGTTGSIEKASSSIGYVYDQYRNKFITNEEPNYLRRTSYEDFFNSLDAWADAGSVNGTFTQNTLGYAQLATGSTTNDVADFQFKRRIAGVGLEGEQKIAFRVHLDNLDIVGNGEFYCVVGDLTATYIGFKVTSAGALQGVVEDGGGEDAVEMDAAAPANEQILCFVQYDNHVDFYRGTALRGSIATSDDPITLGTELLHVQLTTTEAVAKTMNFHSWRLEA